MPPPPWRVPNLWPWRLPSQRVRDIVTPFASAREPRRDHRVAHEGHRAQQPRAHESGAGRGMGRGTRATGRRVRPQSCEGDRCQAAHRYRDRLRGRGDGRGGGPSDRIGILPALHEHRRHGRGVERRLQEHHRGGRGHRRRHGLWPQHHRNGHHQGPCRDHAARTRPRRQAGHVLGSRGHGRPDRDVRLAAVAQPHAWLAHRPGARS